MWPKRGSTNGPPRRAGAGRRHPGKERPHDIDATDPAGPGFLIDLSMFNADFGVGWRFPLHP
jgi:hypothetical protein